MVEGLTVRPLKRIEDHRGSVMHMLRVDDPWFKKFGEIYFSTVHPGIVKGWHLHREMELNYALVAGIITLVVYDEREGSSTKGNCVEIELSPEKHSLVTVPPLVWNGFIGRGNTDAIVANCATIPHDPEEIVRLDWDDPKIPYKWRV